MSDTRLFLVRHGETNDNKEHRLTGWKDPPLSERGERQARAVGRALCAYAPFAAIYSSDLERARMTAWVIAEESAYPIEAIRSTADFREQNFGLFDGLTPTEAERYHPETWRAVISGEWDVAFPEGESHPMVAARAARGLEAAIQSHPGGAIVVVSHVMAMSHMLRSLTEIPQAAVLRVGFWAENAGIHRLRRHSNGTWWVETVNDTSHLNGVG